MLRVAALGGFGDILPEFDDPPVVEVALALQFDSIPGLIPPVVGLFWSRLRDHFPQIEVHPPRPPVVERFGLPPVPDQRPDVQLVDPSEAMRIWLVNEDGTELVQIQRDRIVFNWRRSTSGAHYPRYPRVRQEFAKYISSFGDFLAAERLGELAPNQCEVTYLNHISLPGGQEHSRVDEVVTLWQSHYSESSLGAPEDVRFAARYVMNSQEGDPVGRLHVVLEPAFRSADRSQILALRLTARGHPKDQTVAASFDFLDSARAIVVQAFAAVTQPSMHASWGKRT